MNNVYPRQSSYCEMLAPAITTKQETSIVYERTVELDRIVSHQLEVTQELVCCFVFVSVRAKSSTKKG